VQVDLSRTTLFVLHSTPAEMQAIFNESILPLLVLAAENYGFYETSLFVTGTMESTLAPLIDKAELDNEGIYIKAHPSVLPTSPRQDSISQQELKILRIQVRSCQWLNSYLPN
jgi:molybdopterin-biosynthesis enzyme MoeA-like protein